MHTLLATTASAGLSVCLFLSVLDFFHPLQTLCLISRSAIQLYEIVLNQQILTERARFLGTLRADGPYLR